jgi:3-hydroxyisobutyrate dehydrogenase-like beta-hydroxyacid dehydrogenase
MSEVVAILHPGQMGAALAVQGRRTGARVLWCPAGRSPATARRAASAGLTAVPDLGELLAAADIVLSVCPPEFAADVAAQVADHRYRGIFVEANAISPERSVRIAETVAAAGARAVDGAIIGPPPGDGSAARIYLSGADDGTDDAVERAAAVFRGTDAEPVVVAGGLGAASALKMSFAAFNKASLVLAAVSHALAARHQVTDHLIAEAERLTRSPLARPGALPGLAARAWRWAPEMREIADTLDDAGLPPDLAHATAAVLARWRADKDSWDLPVDEVLARLGGA